MKRFARYFLVFASGLAVACLGLAGCQKNEEGMAAPKTGELTLYLDNGVTTTSAGTATFSKLVLDSGAYQNPNGDALTVTSFKYYVSNVTLRKADGGSFAVPNTYFLVDHSNPATQTLKLAGVPEGDFTGLSFVVGVDSARTKAGNLTGGLNGDKGMLWTVNGVDEFSNVALVGTAPRARTGAITFPIAGYQHSTTNTTRTVTLPFAPATLPVRAGHTPEVYLRADIANMFGGPHLIRFSDTYNVMGGAPAAQVADNIAAGMFTVAHIYAN